MKDVDPEMLLAMQEVDRLASNAPPITPQYGPWQNPYFVLGITDGLAHWSHVNAATQASQLARNAYAQQASFGQQSVGWCSRYQDDYMDFMNAAQRDRK